MKTLYALLLFLVVPGLGRADGVFVWTNQQQDIAEPEQKAFIVHADGWEDLVLSVRFAGAPDNFGWIVPVPPSAKLEAADPQVFEILSKVTQNPDFGETRDFPYDLDLLESEDPLNVTPWRVGIFEGALLASGSARGLQEWLTDHSFGLPPGAAPVLETYRRRGWGFAAMHIVPAARTQATADSLAAGTIAPVHFRFRSERPVFPLLISSLGGHPSEVLIYVLSAEGFVPRNGPGMTWTTHVWSRGFPDGFGHFHGQNRSAFLEGVIRDHGDYGKPLVLTKSRIRVQPEDMEDVEFRPYPYAENLKGNDPRLRAEAATFIGGVRPKDSVPVLESFLATSEVPVDRDGKRQDRNDASGDTPPHQDVISALWALGQIGGGRSVQLLESWAGGGNIRCQTEALASLITVAPDTAVGVCLEQFCLHSPRTRETSSREGVFLDLCRDHLVVRGGSGCLEDLRRLIRSYYDPRAWDEDWLCLQRDDGPYQTGQEALLAAAACGDRTAGRELVRCLGEFSGPEPMVGCAPGRYGVRTLDFYFYIDPFGAGWRIRRGKLHNALVVEALEKDLDVRPALRDSLFRSAVHGDPAGGMPAPCRAYLLAHVSQLEPADEAYLLKIWNDLGIRAGGHPAEAPVLDPLDCDSMIPFGDAEAAAYALGMHGRIAPLSEFYDAMSWSGQGDPKLAVAKAALMTKDSRAVPMAEELLIVELNREFSKPGNRKWLAASDPDWIRSGRLFAPEMQDEAWFLSRTARFLCRWDSDRIRLLARDDSLPLLTRLYLCCECSVAWRRDPQDLKDILQSLSSEPGAENLAPLIMDRIGLAENWMAIMAADSGG